MFDRNAALTALAKAIDLVGGQSALAREATKHAANGRRLTQKTIWKWLNRARGPVPTAEWVVPIEKAVDAAAKAERVTRYELRADVFGAQPQEQELARA